LAARGALPLPPPHSLSAARTVWNPLFASATLSLCFETMTWPHQLARIMAAEQIYRAMTILSGHPYHHK
jgi:23S rRNA pseudoU1915 N3-methylase RlmH